MGPEHWYVDTDWWLVRELWPRVPAYETCWAGTPQMHSATARWICVLGGYSSGEVEVAVSCWPFCQSR